VEVPRRQVMMLFQRQGWHSPCAVGWTHGVGTEVAGRAAERAEAAGRERGLCKPGRPWEQVWRGAPSALWS
jgi:hypothetical protein